MKLRILLGALLLVFGYARFEGAVDRCLITMIPQPPEGLLASHNHAEIATGFEIMGSNVRSASASTWRYEWLVHAPMSTEQLAGYYRSRAPGSEFTDAQGTYFEFSPRGTAKKERVRVRLKAERGGTGTQITVSELVPKRGWPGAQLRHWAIRVGTLLLIPIAWMLWVLLEGLGHLVARLTIRPRLWYLRRRADTA